MQSQPLSSPFRRRLVPLAALLLAALIAAPSSTQAARHESRHQTTNIRLSDDDDGFAWALIEPGSRLAFGGVDDDVWESLEDLAERSGETLVWCRLDGRTWVIRDGALVKKTREIVEPVRKIAGQQGALGARQGALGAKQGALGARQGALGLKQAEQGRVRANLAARRAVLAVKRALLELKDEDDRDVRRALRALERKEAALEHRLESEEEDEWKSAHRRSDLGRRQAELGREQARLGRLQSELGRQQKELGRELKRVTRRTHQEMRSLVREAIRTGRATRAREVWW